ncbi:hypothetical protein ASG87_10460 [Frateuria sp. Soil773]|uniref:hypothetical protein n=1 Tax=Frateuria sp. Soil773 TaxID=1736407 RepID=UPI000700AA54|nr:hypothetical protein [Frateuria sp. Soil773]KRF01919.1 hypothetical protein ASG87_10460 [Frateuria sp. Soil773]
MPPARRGGPSSAHRFAGWSIACWIVLLLAAFGGLQYLRHAAYPYLLASFAVIVVSAGCILRQAWARQPMRVLAVLLVLWALASGGLMLAQWGQFEQARQHALAQPQIADVLLAMIEQARRSYLLGLVLKALLVPLLLWLAWRLGQPAVRGQFRARRGTR